MASSQRPTQGSIVTWLLIGATCLTVPVFLVVWGITLLSEPPSFAGDPDIGGGILLMAGVLNVPVLVGWGLWLGARR